MGIMRPEVKLNENVEYHAEELIPLDDDFSPSRPGSSIHISAHTIQSHYLDNDDGI